MELKSCPNCKKRISINDVQCPYCKYIDDKRYKKENDKLKRKQLEEKRSKKELKKKLNPSKKKKIRETLLMYLFISFMLIVCTIVLIIKIK